MLTAAGLVVQDNVEWMMAGVFREKDFQNRKVCSHPVCILRAAQIYFVGYFSSAGFRHNPPDTIKEFPFLRYHWAALLSWVLVWLILQNLSQQYASPNGTETASGGDYRRCGECASAHGR
jgi:hypothetical protein